MFTGISAARPRRCSIRSKAFSRKTGGLHSLCFRLLGSISQARGIVQSQGRAVLRYGIALVLALRLAPSLNVPLPGLHMDTRSTRLRFGQR